MIRSRRLVLTPIGIRDLAGILRLHQDQRVTDLLVDGIPDTAEKVGVLLAWNRPMAAKGFGTFAVRRHGEAEMLGLFSLTPFKDDEALLELGGRLIPAAWRGGLGVEAGGALVEHAFTALDRPRLVSAFHPENRSVRPALMRLGFSDAGETTLFDRVVCLMALDRTSWRSAGSNAAGTIAAG